MSSRLRLLSACPCISCRSVSRWQRSPRMLSRHMTLRRSDSSSFGWLRSRRSSWQNAKLLLTSGGFPAQWWLIFPTTSQAGSSRGVPPDSLQQQLQRLLAELGFQDGSVKPFECFKDGYGHIVAYTGSLTAEWAAEDATSTSPERSPKAASGTCVTCPICHEHGPAVVLVPCGHVVCRDCHRCQQLHQCPMCRKVITSATQGLFMD